MRHLLLFLALTSQSLASPKSATYQVSCERTMLTIFAKYGASGQAPSAQVGAVTQYCSKATHSVTNKGWATMDYPAGAGCTNAVKAVTQVSKDYPAEDKLFSEMCLSITMNEGAR